MMRWQSFALFVGATALAGQGQAIRAQTPAPPVRGSQVLSASATAVLVDVVVRDTHGRPVTDLTADDFAVSEDGAPQAIASFSRVSRGNGIGVNVAWRTASPTTAVSSDTPFDAEGTESPDEGATAFVFDHLSPQTLKLAQRATLDYVPMTGASAVRLGVFSTDAPGRVLQPYTTDRALIRAAVARLAPAGTVAEDGKADRTNELLTRRREIRTQVESATAGSGGTGSALARNASVFGQLDSEMALVQTELNMLRSFESLDRGLKGSDTWTTLVAVVRSLAEYPGRKTLIVFSEGLPISSTLSTRLDLLVDIANRAHVTAYAIDANGLRATSTLANTRKEIDVFGDDRLAQVVTGSDRTPQPMTMAFERVEETLTLDARAGLARLAEDTGGFLVESSNAFASAFRRIDEDTRFHYLLSYEPKNTTLDGRFRTIDVRVKRAGVRVFSRRGYRAVAAPAVSSVRFEEPAIALLDRTPVPNDFPVTAAGFVFPDPARPGLTAVLVHLSPDVLRFDVDKARGRYAAQAAIVVRIRDAQRQDVQTLSQQYVFSGGAEDVEAAKHGEVLFYREANLPPGIYSMESIAYDSLGRRGSARIATLTVPAPSALAMSSLVIVDRVETVDETPPSAVTPPLYVGRTLIYPNLGEPVHRTERGELPFFFTVYGSDDGLRGSAVLLQNGKPIGESSLEPAKVAGGRIQHVGRLDIRSLTAGTYELRISMTNGRVETSRSAFFTLAD